MRRLLPFALAALPFPALSQGLTSAELWSTWQGAVTSAGGSLTATEKREGNQLVLSDVVLMPKGEGQGAVHLEKLTLVSQADGSVGVLLPEQFPVVVDLPVTPEPDDAEQLAFDVGAPGLRLLILGLGQKAEFQATGPSVSVTLTQVEPEAARADAPAITAALADLELRYKHDLGGALPGVDTAVSVGTLHLEVDGKTDEGAPLRISGDLSALTASVAGAFPASTDAFLNAPDGASPDLQPMLTALADGLFIDVKTAMGASDLTITDGSGLGAFTLAGGSAAIRLDRTVAAWQSAVTGLRVEIRPETASDQTLSAALGEYRTEVSVGLNGLVGPQDWSAAYVIRDLTASQELWALTGLQESLAMAPDGTLAVDLKGRYTLDPIALTPDYVPDPEKPPFTDFSFDINELILRGMGVDLAGTGGLRLNFRDTMNVPGMPATAGRLNFVTKGAYALLDQLIAAGLVTADEAASVRMGLLMVGKAGDDPDTLTTDLDFRDKSFFLNGLKIQ